MQRMRHHKVFLVRHAESEENVHMAATLGAVSRMFKFERLPTASEREKFGKLCSAEDRDAKLSEVGEEQVEDVRAQVSDLGAVMTMSLQNTC